MSLLLKPCFRSQVSDVKLLYGTYQESEGGLDTSVLLRVIPAGHSGRDGQPSVHSCGDTVEILLEVQPEQ